MANDCYCAKLSGGATCRPCFEEMKYKYERQKELYESAIVVNRNLQDEREKGFDLRKFQDEVHEWATRNFGENRDYKHPAMGVVEEVGELFHAFLKQEQGIRGTFEEHEAEALDAVGDIAVYLADLCALRGWNLAEICRKTWNHVKTRDWKKNARDGRECKR